MKKPTLNEVVDKLLSFEGKDRATMIGIGPMSHTLIKASMLLAKEKDFPLMFIASRNQVDADELGGGYVCNWDQKRFAEAIAQVAKENNFDGLYYLCRDHGGPWQRDNERNAHLPEKEAMELGKKSYKYDLENGFDLLHIDPTKDPYIVGKVIDMNVNINRTIELIETAENERKAMGLPSVSYEVGTEETNGGLTSSENYEAFIKKLNEKLDEKNLPHPAFIVGNTGTLTRLTENVGHVDPASCKNLSAIAKKYHVGLKEHNGDYLDDVILLQHPAWGVTAMNVAPEFGTVETQAYLKLSEVEDSLYASPLCLPHRAAWADSISRKAASPFWAKISGMLHPAARTTSSSRSTKRRSSRWARLRPMVLLPAPGIPTSTTFSIWRRSAAVIRAVCRSGSSNGLPRKYPAA